MMTVFRLILMSSYEVGILDNIIVLVVLSQPHLLKILQNKGQPICLSRTYKCKVYYIGLSLVLHLLHIISLDYIICVF